MFTNCNTICENFSTIVYSLVPHTKVKVGDKLKMHVWELRNEKGLSLHQLADMSQLSKSHINEVENGHAMPTIDTLCKLANALGVKVEDLYSCENPTKDNCTIR